MASLNSGSVRSLYPKGPSFTLENFSSKDFIVRDFVEELSESAIPINRRSGPAQPAFDAKPFIRTFESALQQLATLSDELEEKETDLLTSVRRAEIQHDQTLDTLGRKLDESIDSFESLDITLNNPNGTNGATTDRYGRPEAGGNIAVQIGERLEDLDKQRRRAMDANFLIQCWIEVSENGSLISLEDMIRRQGGGETNQRLDPASWANGSKKANGITNGIVGYKGHNTREIIEKFSETLEKDLLKQFDNSYRRQNFDDMLECAKVLHDFNGGSSVIGTFVNQHQFFIDRSQLIAEEVTTDNETWEMLADPDSEPPGVEPSLQSLIDEIRAVMQEESFIIKRAFPFYEVVLIKFIQRIFQQSIQQRLEMVLEKADTISSLAFLRSLHASRTYINSLIEDLKAHGLTEHPEPCTAQTAQSLDQQLDELFVPYLAMMLRVAGLRDLDNNKNEIEVTDEDGVISVANAKRMLKWLAEGVRRALEMGSGSDTPKDVSALLNLLLSSMGEVYIETALEAAADQAAAQENIKTEPDLAYLPSVRPAVIITNVMSRFINTVLIRLAETNTTVRRGMESQTKASVERIEKKANDIMRSTITVVLNWITRLLAGQKKTDFRPKDSDLGSIETLQTATCLAICNFLQRVAKNAAQAVDGQNLEVFSCELAISIRDMLFEHFKKFQVNATGGLMVTKDMSSYVSALKDWPLTKDITSEVEILGDIGNLFIVGAEALKEKSRAVLASGASKKLQKADFKAFVLKRDDSGSVGVQSVLAGL
ncbi:exocyst complex component protein [Botrytis cinerea]